MSDGSELTVPTIILMLIVAGIFDAMQWLIGFVGLVLGFIPLLGFASIGMSILACWIVGAIAYVVFYLWLKRYEIEIWKGKRLKGTAISMFFEFLPGFGSILPGWIGFVIYHAVLDRSEMRSDNEV